MFGAITVRWLTACGGALLVAIAATGCGENDTQRAGSDRITYSEANEPPKPFIERIAKLLATASTKKDCVQLDATNERSTFRFECPAQKRLRRSMARFEVLGAAEYGTGAVVDYKSRKVENGAILLFVAPDRSWGISRFGILTKPSTKTSDDDSRQGYADILDDYLAAVRERDCDAYMDVAFTDGKKKEEVCQTIFATTEQLAKRLKQNPSAEPEYQGGNATYGFYTLETARPKAENSTFSIVRSPDPKSSRPYAVLDVVPSPTAADQRRVREQLEEQQRNGPSSMEPSSKPSDPAVKP